MDQDKYIRAREKRWAHEDIKRDAFRKYQSEQVSAEELERLRTIWTRSDTARIAYRVEKRKEDPGENKGHAIAKRRKKEDERLAKARFKEDTLKSRKRKAQDVRIAKKRLEQDAVVSSERAKQDEEIAARRAREDKEHTSAPGTNC
jgi:hypothetical protein